MFVYSWSWSWLMKKMTIVFLLSVVVVVLCDWILLCVEEWGHQRKTGLQGIYLGHWNSLLVRVLISSIANKYLSPGYNITGLSFIFFSFYHLSEADISVFRTETQIIAWNNTEQLESRPLSKGEPGLSNGLARPGRNYLRNNSSEINDLLPRPGPASSGDAGDGGRV